MELMIMAALAFPSRSIAMKKCFQAVPLTLVLGLVALTDRAQAQGARVDPGVQKKFDKVIDAIKTKNRDPIVADGTEEVKKGVTQELMDSLEKQLGPRFKAGFESTYLCELKQSGHQVHLWKLTFKDKGDDLLFRMVLKDGKVASFVFQ
jgi:hypothetical protein